MVLTTLDYVAAISTSIMILVGWVMAIIAFRLWREKKETQILLSSILFFTLPFPWLNQVIIVVSSILQGELNEEVAVYLTGWSIPALVIAWVFITTSLYSREWIKYAMLFVNVVLGIYVIVRVYFQNGWDTNRVGDTLYTIEYANDVDIVIAVFGLMGLLIVAPTYLYFSVKSQDPLFKFRSRMIGLAAVFFSIAGATDGISVVDTIGLLLLLRMMLLTSLVLLYMGYITPDRIRARYDS